MWEEVLNLAIKNGLWAVLFMALFIFVIKDSTNREKKYQETISNLTEHLGVVKMIKEDVDDIKSIVYKGKKSTSKNSDKKEADKKDER
ncbi:MAG: BhlA/UviB family holin-like peptide [Christensenellales bacterium]